VVATEVAGRDPRIVGTASRAQTGDCLERTMIAVWRMSTDRRRRTVRIRTVSAIVTSIPPWKNKQEHNPFRLIYLFERDKKNEWKKKKKMEEEEEEKDAWRVFVLSLPIFYVREEEEDGME